MATIDKKSPTARLLAEQHASRKAIEKIAWTLENPEADNSLAMASLVRVLQRVEAKQAESNRLLGKMHFWLLFWSAILLAPWALFFILLVVATMLGAFSGLMS